MYERIREGSCTVITVITPWRNEEFLAPLFLKHYDFADQIIILLDESTDDGTIDKIQYSGANTIISVKKLEMPAGFDSYLSKKQIDEQYSRIKNGWVILVDADEFIKIPEMGMREYLSNVEAGVIEIMFWQIYQHKTENRLNDYTPVFEQRKHGIRTRREIWNKPCIVRAGKGYEWDVGHHNIHPYINIHNEFLPGSHWAMADVDLTIIRRILGHVDRQSEADIRAGIDLITSEEEIINICNEYKDCPVAVWEGINGTCSQEEEDYYQLMKKKGLLV